MGINQENRKVYMRQPNQDNYQFTYIVVTCSTEIALSINHYLLGNTYYLRTKSPYYKKSPKRVPWSTKKKAADYIRHHVFATEP